MPQRTTRDLIDVSVKPADGREDSAEIDSDVARAWTLIVRAKVCRRGVVRRALTHRLIHKAKFIATRPPPLVHSAQPNDQLLAVGGSEWIAVHRP